MRLPVWLFPNQHWGNLSPVWDGANVVPSKVPFLFVQQTSEEDPFRSTEARPGISGSGLDGTGQIRSGRWIGTGHTSESLGTGQSKISLGGHGKIAGRDIEQKKIQDKSVATAQETKKKPETKIIENREHWIDCDTKIKARAKTWA
jgi:hypothetical protein